MKKRKFIRNEAGFTIVEIMVVVIIIGILATIVVASLAGRTDDAKVTAAKAQIREFETALDLYKLDNDLYPTTEEALASLITNPGSARNWKGPYLTKNYIPKDPWGSEYIYVATTEEDSYDITSYGRDLKEGGAGYNADISRNTMGEEEME